MLRCKTDSENERARGGPVSNASKKRDGCGVTENVAPVKNGLSAKSSVFAFALNFATITARNVLQHG